MARIFSTHFWRDLCDSCTAGLRHCRGHKLLTPDSWLNLASSLIWRFRSFYLANLLQLIERRKTQELEQHEPFCHVMASHSVTYFITSLIISCSNHQRSSNDRSGEVCFLRIPTWIQLHWRVVFFHFRWIIIAFLSEVVAVVIIVFVTLA